MENSSFTCSLCCETGNPAQFTSFSCSHIICPQCLSYNILANFLNDSGIFEFSSCLSGCLLECLICNSGKAKYSFAEENLKGFSSNEVNEEEAEAICCEACQQTVKIETFCQDCNKYFCHDCFENIHAHYKKPHQNSRVAEQSILKGEDQGKCRCNCKLKEEITLYCLTDRLGICKYCSKFEHEGHELIQMPGRSEESSQRLERRLIDFKALKNEMEKEISTKAQNFYGECTRCLNEIIEKAQSLKTGLQIQIHKQEDSIKKRLEIIENSFINVILEANRKNLGLHPSKVVLINDLSSEKLLPRYEIVDNGQDLNKILKAKRLLGETCENLEGNQRSLYWYLMRNRDLGSPRMNLKRKADKGFVPRLGKRVKREEEKDQKGATSSKNGISQFQNLKIEQENAGKGIVSSKEQQITPKRLLEKLYKKSMENWDPSVWDELGLLWESGVLGTSDEEKAFNSYSKAAGLGCAKAMSHLGVCFKDGFGCKRNKRKAFEWFKKAVDEGDLEAMSQLGWCYFNGFGSKRISKRKALEYFEKAAGLGECFGMNNLGFCYEMGDLCPKDHAKAFNLYSKCAEEGNIQGIENLARCYNFGIGCKPDQKKVVELKETIEGRPRRGNMTRIQDYAKLRSKYNLD